MNLERLQPLKTEQEFRAGFRQALKPLRFIDTHVHDMPLCMGPTFAIQGLDQATAYHYLEGEASLRRHMSRAETARFRAMNAAGRADLVVDAILGQGELAISTAANGLYRIAQSLGIEGDRPFRDVLKEWRHRFGKMSAAEYRDMVFEKSCVDRVVSTQSIFVEEEAALYLDNNVMAKWDPSYEVGVRCDELLRKPAAVATVAKLAGFEAASGDPDEKATQQALRDLVTHFIDRFQKVSKVRYLSLSMGAEDRFLDSVGLVSKSRFAVVMREVIVPLAKKLRLPIFVMPYVKRGLNSVAGSTGDCVVTGPVDDLKQFVATNHDVSFILTGLHPSMNYDFCFLARACPNARLAGFWWGNLNSIHVRHQIQERLEFIGLGWTGLNSDQRITDQELYKWNDYFDDLEHVLVTTRFPQMVAANNPVTVEGIAQTIRILQDPDELFWVAN